MHPHVDVLPEGLNGIPLKITCFRPEYFMFVKAVLGRMNVDFLKVSSHYMYQQVNVPVSCTCLYPRILRIKRHCFLLQSRWVFVTEGFCRLCSRSVVMYNALILVLRDLNSHFGLFIGELFETPQIQALIFSVHNDL